MTHLSYHQELALLRLLAAFETQPAPTSTNNSGIRYRGPADKWHAFNREFQEFATSTFLWMGPGFQDDFIKCLERWRLDGSHDEQELENLRYTMWENKKEKAHAEELKRPCEPERYVPTCDACSGEDPFREYCSTCHGTGRA